MVLTLFYYGQNLQQQCTPSDLLGITATMHTVQLVGDCHAVCDCTEKNDKKQIALCRANTSVTPSYAKLSLFWILPRITGLFLIILPISTPHINPSPPAFVEALNNE